MKINMTLDCWQWTGKTNRDVMKFIDKLPDDVVEWDFIKDDEVQRLWIEFDDDVVTLFHGDYLVKLLDGHYLILTPDDFIDNNVEKCDGSW